MQTPHRFRSKRQLWTYSGLGIETRHSAQYRYVQVIFAADVILRPVEGQYRTRYSGDGSIRSLGSKEVLVLAWCVGSPH
jgi:transposase